jgi:hypothetical protein
VTALEITRGDDEILSFLINDPYGVGADVDDPSTWPPVDLTGCSLWFYVKASSRLLDADAIIAKGPSDVVIDPDQLNNTGQATLALVPSDTASIDSQFLDRTLKYELQLKDSDDKISTVATGEIVIRSDIVRIAT